jgi:hypothetical protein
MEKIDLKKRFKSLYSPSAKAVSEVDVPDFNFLMIDGRGDPNTAPEYAEAVQALYALAYTLKFMLKLLCRWKAYGGCPICRSSAP